MDHKKERLSIPKAGKSLDEFLTGQPEGKKEAKKKQINIPCTQEEIDYISKGHEACLTNMPAYEYHKLALMEKAKKDIEKREKLNKVIQEIDSEE